MSHLASVNVAEAAIYAYVFCYHVLLFAQGRRRGEYLLFGLLAGALSVFAVGAAMMASAETLAEGSLAMRVEAAALVGACALTFDLCRRLTRRRPTPWPWLVYAAAAVGVTLAATGVLCDESTAAPAPTWGLRAAPDHLEPALSATGLVAFVVGWGLVCRGLLLLGRHVPARSGARFIPYALVAALLAAAHDLCVHLMSLRSPTLLEHTALLGVLAMGYLVAKRAEYTGQALVNRSGALSRNRQALRQGRRVLLRTSELAAMGELSAMVAHEVRNPLTVIKNAVSALRSLSVSEQDQSTLLSILREEIDHLHRIADDLLAYARPLVLQGSEIKVRELLAEAIAEARERSVGEGVHFDLLLADGPSELHGDPGLLRHAVVNIVENAIQAMPRGGTFTVRATCASVLGRRGIQMDFQDTGVGMNAETRARAHQPFFTTRPSGTGLGLAIVDRFVRTHGGQLTIRSDPGSGTTIRMRLPLAGEPPQVEP